MRERRKQKYVLAYVYDDLGRFERRMPEVEKYPSLCSRATVVPGIFALNFVGAHPQGSFLTSVCVVCVFSQI